MSLAASIGFGPPPAPLGLRSGGGAARPVPRSRGISKGHNTEYFNASIRSGQKYGHDTNKVRVFVFLNISARALHAYAIPTLFALRQTALKARGYRLVPSSSSKPRFSAAYARIENLGLDGVRGLVGRDHQCHLRVLH